MSKRSWNNGTRQLEVITEGIYKRGRGVAGMLGSAERDEKTDPRSGRAMGPDSKEDKEIVVGSMVVTNYGETVAIDEIDTDSDIKGRTIYIGTDKDGGDHILYPDQIHAVSS
tara:strand:+ start:827 stop:1162 length:336 start_codon:yes stop_codon:yes gene_type:complete